MSKKRERFQHSRPGPSATKVTLGVSGDVFGGNRIIFPWRRLLAFIWSHIDFFVVDDGVHGGEIPRWHDPRVWKSHQWSHHALNVSWDFFEFLSTILITWQYPPKYNFSKQVLKWRKGRWYWICQKSVTIVLGKDCLRKQHDSRIGEATKELRLSVDKKRKHILCRSRPQPQLPLVHCILCRVVEQKNALCARRRTYGGCVPTEAPFLPYFS